MGRIVSPIESGNKTPFATVTESQLDEIFDILADAVGMLRFRDCGIPTNLA